MIFGKKVYCFSMIFLFSLLVLTNSIVTTNSISNLKLRDFSEFDFDHEDEIIESTITDKEIKFEGYFNQTDEGGYDSYRYHMFRRHGNCSDFDIEVTIGYDFNNQLIREHWFKSFTLRLNRNIEWSSDSRLCDVSCKRTWDEDTTTDISKFSIYMVESQDDFGHTTDSEEDYNVTAGEAKFHVWRTGDNLTCHIIQNEIIFYSRSINNSDYLLDITIMGNFWTMNQSIGEYSVRFSDFYANLGFPSTAKVGNNSIVITFTTFFGLIIIQIIKRKFKTKR